MYTPTRASLLSGRYSSRFGQHAIIPLNRPIFPERYQTLASALRDSGNDICGFQKKAYVPVMVIGNLSLDYSAIKNDLDMYFDQLYKKSNH